MTYNLLKEFRIEVCIVEDGVILSTKEELEEVAQLIKDTSAKVLDVRFALLKRLEDLKKSFIYVYADGRIEWEANVYSPLYPYSKPKPPLTNFMW